MTRQRATAGIGIWDRIRPFVFEHEVVLAWLEQR
jgi:hypothetical protein